MHIYLRTVLLNRRRIYLILMSSSVKIFYYSPFARFISDTIDVIKSRYTLCNRVCRRFKNTARLPRYILTAQCFFVNVQAYKENHESAKNTVQNYDTGNGSPSYNDHIFYLTVSDNVLP